MINPSRSSWLLRSKMGDFWISIVCYLRLAKSLYLRPLHRFPEPERMASTDKKNVTIKEVATEAGVSFSTVAKILRGDQRFRAATVERVRAAAAQLGYRVNPAAAALATGWRGGGRAQAIARLEWRNVHGIGMGPIIQKACEARAGALGYHLDLLDNLTEANLRRQLNVLHARGVEGLILIAPPGNLAQADLGLERFSLMTVGRTEMSMPMATVRPDVGGAVRLCFEKLLAAGCQRIGAALHRHDPVFVDDRVRVGAYLECWRRLMPGASVPRIYDAPMGDFDGIDEWLRSEGIDGLIGFSNGDFETLINRGWKIPEDLRFACLTANEANPHALAGANERQIELNELAIGYLDQQLRLRERGLPELPTEHVLSTSWRSGRTLD
ncbi:MAG: LacI family DNA-binding transcriptional regulator [Verrucomicrobiota bacterium]